MAVDWAQALQIGGIGFGLVFTVLIVLALAMWLTGLVLNKIGSGVDTPDTTDKSVPFYQSG